MDGILTLFRNAAFTPAALRRRPLTHLLLLIIAAALLWEGASAARLVREDTWPPPSTIVRTLWTDLWTAESAELGDQNRALPLAGHLVLTLQKWAIAFGIAIVIGVATGAILGTSRTVFAIGYPIVSVLRAMPSAAIWPISVLLIGLGSKSQLVTVVFGAVWPVLLSTLNALTSLAPEVRDSMQFMQLSPPQKLLTQIHWALPGIFTGVELSCSVAFLLAVTVEVFDSSNGGIGWYMDFHKQTSEYAHIYAGVLLTGLVGWGLNSLMHFTRGTVLFWERGANRRIDILARVVTTIVPRRKVEVQLASKIGDERLRTLITADDVSAHLTSAFRDWELELMYLGPPYFWPLEAKGLAKDTCVQRDIRIIVPFDSEGRRAVLVAQSWLDQAALSDAGRAALYAGRLTLGQIVRGVESGLTLATGDVDTCISEKLGLAFGINGAVEAVQRTRTLSRNGKRVGVVFEYVPVLLGHTQVFAS